MWIAIQDNPPEETEILLWLKADAGMEKPIGAVVASYMNTDMGSAWVEKSVAGNINTGLRADLITHYQLLDGEPDESV